MAESEHAEHGGAGVAHHTKQSDSLRNSVMKLELAKQNDPQSALASFPGSLHVLNVVQVIVGTSEAVSIDVKKFLNHAQEMQEVAMEKFKNLESKKNELEIKIKATKEGSEVHLKLRNDLDTLSENIIAERKEAEKNAINPAVTQKLRTSLSGNCTLVVHEVRDTLLLAHENCSHMTKAAERVIALVEAMKKEMYKGPEAKEAYLKIINREADTMYKWASEVGESAMFTNKVVDAVQLLLVDQIEENSREMQEAKLNNKLQEEKKRRKERQIEAAVRRRQQVRREAEEYKRKARQNREIFDIALDDQKTARYAGSWRRIFSFGLGYNPTDIEKAKVDCAREQIRHFQHMEKKAREEAFEQSRREQELMDVVIQAANDIALNTNKAEKMKRMCGILGRVQAQMAKFQESWMQLRRFTSKLCVENRHLDEGAKNALEFSELGLRAGLDYEVNVIDQSAWITGKFAHAYSVLSNTVLFPLCGKLLETTAQPWGSMSTDEINKWNSDFKEFYDGRKALMDEAWKTMNAKKSQVMQGMLKKAEEYQKEIGTKISIEITQITNEIKAAIPAEEDDPQIKMQRVNAARSANAMKALVGMEQDPIEDAYDFEADLFW